jgi:hypothetical protein
MIEGEKWRGQQWHLHAEAGGLRVWIANEGVIATADRSLARFESPVNQMRDVLDWLDGATVDVAVFPEEAYHEACELDPVRLAWVKGCVKDAIYCVRDGANTNLTLGDSVEDRHEMIHCLLGHADNKLPFLAEGVAEAVARFALHQHRTQDFYLSLDVGSLRSAAEIGNSDLMGFSSEPPGKNPDYASAALFVAGVAVKAGCSISHAAKLIQECECEIENIESSIKLDDVATSLTLQELGYANLFRS